MQCEKVKSQFLSYHTRLCVHMFHVLQHLGHRHCLLLFWVQLPVH